MSLLLIGERDRVTVAAEQQDRIGVCVCAHARVCVCAHSLKFANSLLS